MKGGLPLTSNEKDGLWNEQHLKWSLPNFPWVVTQTWSNLLFAHYPVKLSVMRKLVPDVLPLDTYNGMCWVGIVPFQITNNRVRGMPTVPGTNHFPELNVRTYVILDGKPGVYFFSLDAMNHLAVKVASTFFHLPYVYAKMNVKMKNDRVFYESRRSHATFNAIYEPTSEPFKAEKDSFDEWLVERYRLYTVNPKGEPCKCDILHKPWSLQKAKADFFENKMLQVHGIQVENSEPVLHFAKERKVRMWPLMKV